jgi:hypothetical protein
LPSHFPWSECGGFFHCCGDGESGGFEKLVHYGKLESRTACAARQFDFFQQSLPGEQVNRASASSEHIGHVAPKNNPIWRCWLILGAIIGAEDYFNDSTALFIGDALVRR